MSAELTPDADRRGLYLALALGLVGLALLLLFTPVLPIQDAPMHLLVLDALDRLDRGDAALAAVMERRPLAPVYAWFYGLGRPLVPLLGAEGVLRAYLLAHLAMWAACLWAWLGTDPDPRRRWFLVLAGPVVLHGVFYLGFLNLLFVYPLVALALRCASPRRAPPGPRAARARAAALAGLGLVCVGLHPLGVIVWGAAVGPFVLLAAAPGARLRAALPLVVPLLAFLAVALFGLQAADPERYRAYEVSQGPYLGWKAPQLMVAGMVQVLLPAGGPALALQALAVALGVAAALLGPRSDPAWAADPERRACLVTAGLAALGAVAGPFSLGEVNNVSLRLTPLVPLLLLGALPPGLCATRRRRVGLALLGAGLLLAHGWAFLSFSRQAAPALALGAAEPAGRRLLPLVLSIHPRAFPRLEQLRPLPCTLARQRGWIQPYLWREAHIPVLFREEPPAPRPYGPTELTRAQAVAWDLVLTYADPQEPQDLAELAALLAGPLRGARLLEERAGWRLYRAPRGP